MTRLGNLSINIKLNLLLIFVFSILLVTTMLLLSSNTATLTEEIGSERIAQEVSIMNNHLAEVQKELLVNVNFTASSVPLIQAVGRRNAETVLGLVQAANESLGMDDIDVVDGDGNSLTDLNPSASDEPLKHFLVDALKEEAHTGLIFREVNGGVEINLAAVAPINNIRQGTVLGAIQMVRTIDDDFLRTLAFERDGVYLGIIYDNKFQARTTSGENDPDHVLHGNIGFDLNAVNQAANGETVILDKLISNGNVPYTAAYIPLPGSNKSFPVTLMVLVELNQIAAFQSSTLLNTIIAFAILSAIAVFAIYYVMRKMTVEQLNSLKNIARDMIGGNYDRRIPITKQDEVGQLASTFNEMAEAVQQREVSIQAARAQAERSDQVKSAFLASMSHELRTPLNAVINFTRFVLDGDTGPVNEQQAELLTEVVGSAKHLLNLINDVLDMSKIEAGSLNLFVEDDVDLNAIVNSVVTTGRGLLSGKPTRLHTEVESNLPLIRADRQRILQVLLNIMSNACKFTEEGEIRIKTSQKDGEVLISISDTGPGIAPADQAMVFEAFKQTKEGLRQGGGTGLGMPIAKSLAEAHGGRMWLESEYGKGSTFFVALPIKSEMLVPMPA